MKTFPSAIGVSRGFWSWSRYANARSGRYFRILNEVPTVLLLIIVFMVVVKPF